MTNTGYSRTAILLHWAIAGLLAVQFGMGYMLGENARAPGLFATYQLHKSLGILILLLSLARLGLRLLKPVPHLPGGPRWQTGLASAVHIGFYAVMILAPLSGWLIVSTSKINVPTLLFGTLAWPHLPVPKAWHGPAEWTHGVMIWVAAGLIALHLAGVARHLLGGHRAVLARMIPAADGPGLRPIAALLLAMAGLSGLFIWGYWFRSPAPAAAPSGVTVAQAPAPARSATPATVDADAPTETAANGSMAEVANASAVETSQPLADWTLLPGGELAFTVDVQGAGMKGRFPGWRADIRFSPDDLAGSRIRVEIPLGAVAMGDAQQEEMLRGADFFNVASHPTALFTARRIEQAGDNRYRAIGTLSLRGASQPVTLSFSLTITGDQAKVKGSATIDRLAFGVGAGEWAGTDQIAASIPLTFQFSARRAD